MSNALEIMSIQYSVLAFTLPCWGCGSAIAPAMADDLTTIVALDRSILGPTDTAVVTVTVRNATSRSIVYQSSCRAGVFRVYRDSDRVDRLFCGIPEAELIRLRPGESLSSATRWTIVSYRGGGASDTLPPGRYTVVGGVDVFGDLKARSPAVAVEDRAP